ncbi:hypothetical protein IE81DRAFT_52482 [Ceraceosorus guamensis]|uniref:Uncharacterized protein n=1 Tax=Ceraceosorus guamensis TaxID=1522189 RepID=A0A316W8B7_9BASI|nr:hypothetical protein IE81DRAFT_52482 [Ceraceosorus guamensis]PWN43925.1 hypothetical protein IE81DRAFT_52482 [Ceraceosorus guamensis]
MYLPRSPALDPSGGKSFSGESSIKGRDTSTSTPASQSSRTHHTGLHPNTWASATTAPASVQVHYHYLAGRYRDLSTEHGLGLAKLGSVDENAVPAPGSDRSDADSRASHKASLGGIFLGAGPETASRGIERWDSTRTSAAKLHVPIGKKSRRETALQRMKQDDLLRRRIEGTKDVGRLKWEAKSALLSHSHPLAIILLARAAKLSSLSSCITLASLLTTGITRGSAPVVVLLERDPLRALSWCLDAAALLQKRSSARHRRGKSSPKEEERLRQQIASLLARLVRTTQADPMRQHGEEVKLPVARTLPAPELWSSLSGLLGWLSGPPQTPSSETPADLPGPDDEDEEGKSAAVLRSIAVDLALVRAVAITRATLAPGQSGWTQAVRREWDEVRDSADAAGRMDLSAVLAAAQTVCAELDKGKRGAIAGPAASLAQACEESLVERSVRVVTTTNSADAAPLRSTSVKKSQNVQRSRRGSLDRMTSHTGSSDSRPPSLLFPVAGSSAPAQTTHTPVQVGKPDVSDGPARRQVGRTISLQPGSSRDRAAAAAAAQSASSLGPSRQSAIRARRPSSVCSDSPSLLFPNHDSDEDDASSAALSSTRIPSGSQARPTSLWAAESEDATIRLPPSRSVAARRRVTSLYGEPSVTDASGTNATGSTASDYGYEPNGVFDPTASLRNAQRRRRVDSSATSASTALSVLSTAPSMAESMAWERERESPQAYAHFSLPSTDSASARLDVVGRKSDAQAPGAVDSLRSLSNTRTAAPRSEQASVHSGDGPAARSLTSRLEKAMTSSSSISRASGAGLAHHRFPSSTSGTFGLSARQRTTSNASISSLSSFVSSSNRQGRNGTLRSPISPTFPQSITTIAPPGNREVAATATMSPAITRPTDQPSADRAGSSASAINSLRRFGGSNGKARPAVPSDLKGPSPTTTVGFPSSTSSSSRSAADENGTAQENGSKRASLAPLRPVEGHAAQRSNTLSPPGSANRRSFFGVDPTSAGTYGQDHAGVSNPDPNPNGATVSESESLMPLSPRPIDQQHPQEKSMTASSSRTASVHTNSDLDAALASAEDKSRLKTASACSRCGTQVVNAPVSRSGHVFCGRQCRMEHKAAEKKR